MNGKYPFMPVSLKQSVSAIPIVLLCMMGFFFLSCGENSRRDSFITSLGRIDGYIAMGRAEKAIAELDKLTGVASSTDQWLSIVKREQKLGVDVGKTLASAVKSVPGSERLAAVYTSYLMSEGNFSSASRVSAVLKDGAYASLYAEAALRAVPERDTYFAAPEFAETFDLAWKATGNPVFLRNAAVIYATQGNMPFARRLHPSNIEYTDMPFFWALISYDAGDYMQAYDDALIADEREAKKTGGQGLPQARLLMADSAFLSGDSAKAVHVWESCIADFPSSSPYPYFNNSLQVSEYPNKRALLTSLTDVFPCYVPGLAAYGQLALYGIYQSSDDDIVTAAVRGAGLSSLAMEEADARVQVPLADVASRMERARGVCPDPLLELEYNKFNWKAERKSAQEQMVDIWYLLEENPDNAYMREYVLWLFLYESRIQDARRVLDTWLIDRYGTSFIDCRVPEDSEVVETPTPGKKNPEILQQHLLPLRLTGWEQEYSALCMALEGDTRDAAVLFQVLANDEDRSLRSLINLACVRESENDHEEARRLYGLASGLTGDKHLKSIIHYRIGRSYAAQGDLRKAKTSVSYSLSLDPENYEARLLSKKL